MRLHSRAASIAAVSLFAISSIGVAAPTFASNAETASVPQLINEAVQAEVPANVAVEPAAPAVEPAVLIQETPTKPSVKARSLADAVRAHVLPAELDRETECLAGAVYFEARAETLEGQLAVAEVILNRANSGRFPSTACGVVFQRSQFSFVRGGRMPAIARDSRDWRKAVAIAQIAQEELWESSVSGALFFHASRVSPGWRKQRIARLGNHVFYR